MRCSDQNGDLKYSSCTTTRRDLSHTFMSDTNSPAPRRSQRDKKAVQPFISCEYILEMFWGPVFIRKSAAASSGPKKRKRPSSDTDNDAPDPVDAQVEPSDESEEGGGDEAGEEGFEAPRAKGSKPKRKSSPKAKTTPTTKKPRPEKIVAPKPLKVAARRGRKPKEAENACDADQVAKDTKISADNPLFSAYRAFSSRNLIQGV